MPKMAQNGIFVHELLSKKYENSALRIIYCTSINRLLGKFRIFAIA